MNFGNVEAETGACRFGEAPAGCPEGFKGEH